MKEELEALQPCQQRAAARARKAAPPEPHRRVSLRAAGGVLLLLGLLVIGLAYSPFIGRRSHRPMQPPAPLEVIIPTGAATRGDNVTLPSRPPASLREIGIGQYAVHPTLETMYDDEYRRYSAPIFSLASPSQGGLLFGPLTTNPGDWVTTTIPANEAMDVEHITAFTGDGVDEHGQSFSYPPLHVHHIHIRRALPTDATRRRTQQQGQQGVGQQFASLRRAWPFTRPLSWKDAAGVEHPDDWELEEGEEGELGDEDFERREWQQHWFETHGDYAPNYTTAVPAGYCRVRGDGRLSVFAQFVDARPKSADAPPLRFWMRIQLEVTKQPCKPVGKLVLWYPLTDFSMDDYLMRYDAGNTDRLSWWSMRVGRAGRLVTPAWLHCHRARFGGLMVLRGQRSPFDYGGLTATCAAGSRTECSSVAALRAFLLQRAASDVLCNDNASAPTFWRSDATPGSAAPSFYDRQGQLLCKPHEFEAGETATIFVFQKPVWAPENAHFAMHTMVFMHFAPRDDNRAAIQTVTYVEPGADYNSMGTWDLQAARTEQRRIHSGNGQWGN